MKTRILATLITVLLGVQLFAQNVKRPDTYYYNRGFECLREGKEADAYDYFEKETRDNPKNGYAFAWMGYILYDNEMYGDALSMLEKAQKNIPSKDKEYLCMVCRIRGDIYTDLQDYDEAAANYTKAIRLCPDDSRCYDDRADLYYQIGKYDLSDKDYDKMIELDPNDSQGYMGKGRNANAQKKYEDAIKQFDHVVKLYGKDYSQCYSFRAEAYAALDQYDKAADDIITALGIDGNDKAFYLLGTIMADSASTTMTSKLRIQQLKEPNNYYWPYCSGIVYEETENFGKAIDCYKKSNELNSFGLVHNRIASCYAELGDYAQAIDHIGQAIQMEPEKTIYKMYKANYEYDAGLTDEALADMDVCIAEAPEYYYFHYRKGFFEDNLNMTDEAIEDYSTAILLNPDYFYSYSGRGDMYTKKGLVKNAMDDYRSVVAKDTVPSMGSCAQYAYLALGERAKAVEYNQRIIDSFPDNNGVYYNAACLYSLMGETDKALGYLKTAFEKGYNSFAHIGLDDDLDNIRDTQAFKDMVAEYRAKVQPTGEAAPPMRDDIEVEIPFTKTRGVTEVQCIVNGLPLHFVFDTGASDVTMSMVEATFMLKNKYLSPLDVVGKQNYLTADGNVSEGTVINLKSVKIGDLELTNVRASVVKSQNAPLLLGQSVLGRLGKIEIDNEKRVIRVRYRE